MITSMEEIIACIRKNGFLSFNICFLKGFSLEEQCDQAFFKKRIPEEWIGIFGENGIACGRFFDGRMSLITKEWFPVFANYRRDGYDFDALFDEGKTSYVYKRIMDHFPEEGYESVLSGKELRCMSGFEAGTLYEDILTDLEYQTYLIRRNGRTIMYGTPEGLFGYDHVRSLYREDPLVSGKKIAMDLFQRYPDQEAEVYSRLIGQRAGITKPAKRERRKDTDYPANLLKAVNHSAKKEIIKTESLTEDQRNGLIYALCLLSEGQQEFIRLYYEEGKDDEEIAALYDLQTSSAAAVRRKGIKKLAGLSDWYVMGYKEMIGK